jgi:GT2 family glycosyltransferase
MNGTKRPISILTLAWCHQVEAWPRAQFVLLSARNMSAPVQPPQRILPEPAPGQSGWPFYTGPVTLSKSHGLKLSVVTPSYNQGNFLEAAIRSVLMQDYPDLEYILVEDGSKDHSLSVAQKYEHLMAKLISGPNQGNGVAMDDGTKAATGDILSIMNADDFYLPGALALVARVFSDLPEVEWIAGHSIVCDPKGVLVRTTNPPGFNRTLFYSGRYLGGHAAWNGRWIPHESVFIRRSLWERAGGHFNRARPAMNDFELWVRLWQQAELYVLPVPLAGYRIHPSSFTQTQGNKSLGPCTAWLDTVKAPKLSPGTIRLRSLLCKMSNGMLNRFGLPAKVLEFDMKADRWLADTMNVM